MSKPFRCLYLTLLLVTYVMAPAYSAKDHTNKPTAHLSDCNGSSTLSNRLEGMNLELSASACDAHLQRKLRDYLGGGSHSTERMLGRANQYYPIFEYYLAKHGMPESLKHLAVAESMLVPRAVSGANAAGLWQLMPATARGMGLRVDGVVDERLDLYRSTEAAVVMLKSLYQQFGDWHLALAAYNCGPGRVRRAVRRAQGYTRYTRVKPFLPRESQNYVAAYVAAAYTLTYYDDYGLTPAEYRPEDEVAQVEVDQFLRLRELAKFCGMPADQLRKLNPAFLRGYVPRSERGYRLRVPHEYKWLAREFVWGRPNLVAEAPDAELALAYDSAARAGQDYLLLLTGIRTEALLGYSPSIAQQAWLDNMTLHYYQNHQAIAMN